MQPSVICDHRSQHYVLKVVKGLPAARAPRTAQSAAVLAISRVTIRRPGPGRKTAGQTTGRHHRACPSATAKAAVPPGKPGSRTGRNDTAGPLLSPGYPRAGCPFRAKNPGWPLPTDAGSCLIAEVVSKPGAGSRFAGRSLSLLARESEFSSCDHAPAGSRPSRLREEAPLLGAGHCGRADERSGDDPLPDWPCGGARQQAGRNRVRVSMPGVGCPSRTGNPQAQCATRNGSGLHCAVCSAR